MIRPDHRTTTMSMDRTSRMMRRIVVLPIEERQ